MGISQRWHHAGDVAPESLLEVNSCGTVQARDGFLMLVQAMSLLPRGSNLLATPSNVPVQRSLLVLSSVLCFSASTAQKDVRNLHLTPWFQHWLPEPCHLCKYSSARLRGAGRMLRPHGREQQFPVLLCSVPQGHSPVCGPAQTSCVPSAAASHAARATGAGQEHSEGHSPHSQLLCPFPLAATQASPLTSSCCWGVGGLCLLCAGSTLCTPASPFLVFSSFLSLSLPLPRLKWIMRSLITKTWQLFPRLKPSMKCSVLTSFPTSPITDTCRMRRWRDIAMGRY